jgi:hypothetical protein
VNEENYELLMELSQARCRMPGLRLGQLLVNASQGDLWTRSDKDLIADLHNYRSQQFSTILDQEDLG